MEATATTPEAETMLRPGETCWRIEHAGRIAPIVDAEDYYRAVYDALSKARRSIFIVGWDLEPRTPLLRTGNHRPPSGTLQEILEDLVARRPELEIRVLIWDMSMFVAVQHPTVHFRVERWTNPERLHYAVDGEHPLGAAHHQKMIMIDDAVAFCGGMDLAGDRWDTRHHHDREPLRRRPDGAPYPPHHDVALAVDGAAARALGDLARYRWRRATGEALNPVPAVETDAWPDGLVPMLRDRHVAIARTLPAMPGQNETREVEALYQAAIRSARDSIYIENQYFACSSVGRALAERLAERDGPEVVVVCPERSPSYFDHMIMDPLREQLYAQLHAADRWGRLRLYEPRTENGEPIIVHSKVMIVDDRFLRVGSANLNDRSMGFDTECDLAVEAVSRRDRAAVTQFRDDLLAEHLGVTLERFASAAPSGSLVRKVEALRRAQGRSLYPMRHSFPTAVRRAVGKLDMIDPSRPPIIGRRPDRLPLVAAFGALALGLWLLGRRHQGA